LTPPASAWTLRTMRIHIQNPEGDALFAITQEQWQSALARR
jgi:hypothetical protein